MREISALPHQGRLFIAAPLSTIHLAPATRQTLRQPTKGGFKNNKSYRGDNMGANTQRRLTAICFGAMMLAPWGLAHGAMEDALLSAEPVVRQRGDFFAETAYDAGGH